MVKTRTPLEAVANTVRPVYQKIAGAQAPLAALPLAIVRRFRGNVATLEIDGRPIRVDLRDVIVAGEMLFLKRYEPRETELLKKIIELGDTVVDVGANIGYFTILMAERVGREGFVVAIEPDAENAAILEQNVALHEIQERVAIVRAAVSDTPGNGQLFRSQRNHGDHRMWRTEGDAPRGEARTPADVEIRTLDSILDGRARVDLMKIDIQGYEPKAIAGMSRFLAQGRIATMLFEFWPYGLRGAGFDPRRLLADIWDAGLETWQVTSTGLDRVDGLEFVDRFTDRRDANIFAANRAIAAGKLSRVGL